MAKSLALVADRPTSVLALTLFRKLLNLPEPQIPYLQNEANRAAAQGSAMRMKWAGAPRALVVIITRMNI